MQLSKRGLDRRRLLAGSAAAVVASLTEARRAAAQAALPVEELRKALSGANADIVEAGTQQAASLARSYNLRTLQVPRVRVLPRTVEAVSETVRWAVRNNVPIAVRGGGHSFEGLSAARDLVIDMRRMNRVVLDTRQGLTTVEAGATQGQVYDKLAASGLGFPGGSCPDVGIAGVVLGGGYGLFSRAWGLAADQLDRIDLVDAQGARRTADADTDSDLYWACRGGGGGTFGIATSLRLRVKPLDELRTIATDWRLPVPRAVSVLRAFQAWIVNAPDEITAIMRIERARGEIALKLRGHTLGGETRARREIANLTRVAAPERPVSIRTATFPGFTAPGTPVKMKGKSDLVSAPITDAAFTILLDGLLAFRPGVATAILDGYGGAIGRVAAEATAFAHRSTMVSIQYYSAASDAETDATTAARVAALADLYARMRPHVGAAAYVNYADADLSDYATRYWGANLPRLRSIKKTVDPANVFRHPLSVPPAG